MRLQVGQLVAAQVVEDEGMLRIPRGAGAHHTYSAALKRVMQKGRAVMSLAELEATVAWLERNRLSDHLHLLEGDAKYAGPPASGGLTSAPVSGRESMRSHPPPRQVGAGAWRR